MIYDQEYYDLLSRKFDAFSHHRTIEELQSFLGYLADNEDELFLGMFRRICWSFINDLNWFEVELDNEVEELDKEFHDRYDEELKKLRNDEGRRESD